MGQQGLRFGCSPIQTVSQETGRIGIKKTKGRLHQMGHPLLTDICSRTECGEMRTHQRSEIDQDPSHSKAESHPSVLGNSRRLRPVWRNRDQVPCHQPYTDIRNHPKDHGDGRESQS